MHQKKTTPRQRRHMTRPRPTAPASESTAVQKREELYAAISVRSYPKIHIPSSLASAPVLG